MLLPPRILPQVILQLGGEVQGLIALLVGAELDRADL